MHDIFFAEPPILICKHNINMQKMLLLFVLFMVQTVHGQTLSGTVSDAHHAPIAFANIVVLSPDDSTFVSGTTSQADGSFTLTSIQKGQLLKVSCIGYEPFTTIYGGTSPLHITLADATKLLSEVVVKSKRPQTQFKGEGMLTTIAGSLLAKTTSMEQLLNNIPQVSARNGTLEVFGRGTPEVYINNRKMQDNNELTRLQPSEIKTIEVITNPGVRYNAQVKSVIRITTKKLYGEGWGIDAQTSVGINDQTRTSGTEAVNLNYRQAKWELSATLSGNYTHRPDDKDFSQHTFLADTWQQDTHLIQEYTNISHYTRLAGSYLFSVNHTLGASISYFRYARNHGEGDMATTSLKNQLPIDRTAMHYSAAERPQNASSNVYYVGKIGKVSIDFNTDFFWSGRKSQMYNHERYTPTGMPTTEDWVNSDRRVYARLLASKLVIAWPLCSGKLTLGGEYSTSKRKSRYTLLPQHLVDNEQSRIRENMTSAFFDYNRNFGKLYLQAGLRYEYIDFNYYAHGIYRPAQSKNYGKWFPSLTLSMPVGTTEMQLTYATDINRPTYEQLREGIQYDNRYTYEAGNPFLLPTISRNVGYGLSWKWFLFNARYAHVSDDIYEFSRIYRGNPQLLLNQPENVAGYNRLQTSLSLRPKWGIWSPRFEASLSKQWMHLDIHEGALPNHPVASFRLNNVLDGKWGTFSLLTTLRTRGNEGNVFYCKPRCTIDLSLYKALLQQRLSLQFYASNLFHTGKDSYEFYSGTAVTTRVTEFPSTAYWLTVRYRFNTTNSRYKGTGAGQSQRNRM